jgi:thiol-disulfide isomerase/thioredoxin
VKKLFGFTIILVLLVFIVASFAAAYQITILGNLDKPPEELPRDSAFLIDTGNHAMSEKAWLQMLSEQKIESVVLPSQKDWEKRSQTLEKLAQDLKIVVTNPPENIKQDFFLPWYVVTHNYHKTVLLNFWENGSLPDSEALNAFLKKENPDRVVVVSDKALVEKLLEELSEWRDRTSVIVREESPQPLIDTLEVKEKPVFLFFYSSRCPVCRKIKNEITPPVFAKYQDQIKVVYFDYVIESNYRKLVELEEYWRVEDKTSVEIFSEIGYLASEDLDSYPQKLEEFIKKTLEGHFPPGQEKPIQQVTRTSKLEEYLFSRLKGATFWVIAGAGLLDGLNPCAFATIVFMVNLLFLLGHERRRIFEVGITYSISVYVTYFLLGLFFFEIWQHLGKYHIISQVAYGVMAALLFLFASLSIKDAIQYKKERRETGFTLGLPKSWRLKINQYLKQSFAERRLIIAALLSGVVVSFLEAGCTGQIYFPIIMLIHSETAYRIRAIFYLLLYNAFFIIPLFAVFLSVYFGSRSKKIVEFGRRNILFSKIALAALFIVLGILLLEGAIY